MTRSWRAIGMMSGTSLDGIDCAMIETDGRQVLARDGFLSQPYETGLRERLRTCAESGEDLAGVGREITLAHAEVVHMFIEKNRISINEIDVIGFHGHTIGHWPERGETRQIGDGVMLAKCTGIPVVNDFRGADMVAGGQGAPMAPVYHAALAADLAKPLAVLNIGGVANVTWIGGDGTLLAFDTGPGNAQIDDWVLRMTGDRFDADGALAAVGAVDADRVVRVLAQPYFLKEPPKSLDRNDFHASAVDGLSAADGAATLTAITVGAVARARDWLPEPPRRWLVTGGGRHNGTLMAGLRRALSAPVDPVEAVGWHGDALEAEAFAYLAVLSRLGLALSVRGTTGVRQPQTGGTFHPVVTG